MFKKLLYFINYLWRVLATGLFFSFFGIGALLIVYLIVPWLGRHKTQHVISNSFRFFIFAAQVFGLIGVKFKSFEKLQHDQGCLIISNHPTLLDYVLIISQLKQCNTIVKDELWNNVFLKKIIRLANYIPNKKFTDIIPLIQQALKEKNNILIFPEGTRTVPRQPIKLKRGAAQIAIRLGAPIRIVRITCQPHTLAKSHNWYNIPPKKPLFTLEAKEIIDPKEFLRDSNVPSIAARHLTQYLQTRLVDKT
jgi:1-acyl-sn-glycerol-3-phosphate acyltransferase